MNSLLELSKYLYDALIDFKAKFESILLRLDALEYVKIAITSFSNNVNNVEKGTVVNSITFNYAFNKVPANISINNGIGLVDANSLSVTKAVNITNNTTFSLNVSDAKNSVTANTTINFLNKVYWGTKANTALTNSDILALSSSTLASAKNRTITLDGSGQYIYYCYPASFGDASFFVGGLASSAWTKSVQDVTNALGNVTTYNVYRTNNVQNGTGINIQIN